jgi:hypothetical protein
MRTRRLIAAVVLAASSALATFAVAQPNRPKPATSSAAKPKPGAPAKPDAGAAPPAETSTADGGDAPVEPPPAAESGDGGRPSPLNPTAQEMPGNADAGAPIDYDRLLADIAALRARVAAVSDNLYQSRINVMLETSGDHGKITKLTVALDDGVVYTAPASFAASDMTTVYDHAVAPGRHAVTIDVERKDDRDEAFRTSQRNRFMVDVPRDHALKVEVKVIDDSAMGADFPSDKSGKYDLRFRVKATAKPAGK